MGKRGILRGGSLGNGALIKKQTSPLQGRALSYRVSTTDQAGSKRGEENTTSRSPKWGTQEEAQVERELGLWK